MNTLSPDTGGIKIIVKSLENKPGIKPHCSMCGRILTQDAITVRQMTRLGGTFLCIDPCSGTFLIKFMQIFNEAHNGYEPTT
jgi:hypothetical protein